jgi:hypothetical protein
MLRTVEALRFLCQLDSEEGQAMTLPVVMTVLRYYGSQLSTLGQLATLEKQLLPIMPKIYELLDQPERPGDRTRLNLMILLEFLPANHTRPVQAKLQEALKDPRSLNKLAAARILLRTNPPDKSQIATAMAEILATDSAAIDIPYAEILETLRALGPEAKAAVPSLRVAVNAGRPDVKAKVLMAIAAIDPGRKNEVLALADQWFRNPADQVAGAAVLCRLGAENSDSALQVLGEALQDYNIQTRTLQLLEWVGPRAKPLVPMIEEILADRDNSLPIQAAAALSKIDGDKKLLMERVVQIVRRDKRHFAHMMRVLGGLGQEARPLVPTLFELAKGHVHLEEFYEAILRIDPAALNREP